MATPRDRASSKNTRPPVAPISIPVQPQPSDEEMTQTASARANQTAALKSGVDSATAMATSRAYAGDITRRAASAARLEEENRRLRLRISELENTASAQDEELIALRETSVQLAKQIEINHRLEEQITNSSNENARLREDHALTLNNLAIAKRSVSALRLQLDGRLSREDTKDLKDENERLKETLRQAESRETRLDQTRLDQKTTILRQQGKISSLENQLETSQLATEEALRQKNKALDELAAEKVISRGLQKTIDNQTILLSDAESNIGRLEKELETLKSSNTADADKMHLKERELQAAKLEIITLKKQIEELKNQLAAQQLIIDDLRSQVDALTLENTQLKGALATAATTITNLTGERNALSAANGRLAIDLQSSQHAKAALQEQVDGLTTAIATLTTAKNAADAEVRNVEAQLTEALGKTEQDAGEIQRLTSLLKVSTENADTLATNLADKTHALDEANQTILRLNAEIVKLKEQIDDLKRQLAEKTTELSDAQATITRLTGELNTAQEECATAISERNQAQATLKTRADELAAVTGQVASLTTEVSTLITEKNKAIAAVERLTAALGDAHETSVELEAAKRKLSSLHSDLDIKSTQLQSANGQIVDLNSEVEQLNLIIQQKDAKISELEGKITELTLENTELRQKLQEQDSEITKLGLSLEEAKTEAKTAKIAQKFAEDTLVTVRRETEEALANATTKIGALQDDIDVLNRNAQENADAILAKQGELDTAQSTASDLRSQLSTAEEEAAREKERADELASKVETLEDQLDSAQTENARLKVDIEKLTDQASALQSTVNKITRQNETVNEALQAALSESQQLTNDLGIAEASIVSLRKKLDAEEADKAATQLLLNEAIANKKRLETKLDDQQLRVKFLEGQVGTLSRQLSSKTRECGKLRDLVIEHKRMLAEQTQKRELAETDLLKSQELLRETTTAKDALALQLGEAEEKLSTANTDMALMKEKHLTEIQALNQEAQDYQKQLDDLSIKHAESINRIKSRLLTVIEEKKEILSKLVVAQQTIANLKQESQELKTELEDTKKSLESTKKELAGKASEVEEGTRLLKESEEKRVEAENARKLAEKAAETAEAEARKVAEENHALQQVVIDAKADVSTKDAQLEAVRLQLANKSASSDEETARLTAERTKIQNELAESRKREEESQKRLQDFERQASILRAQKAIIAAHKQSRAIYDIQLSLRNDSQGKSMTMQYDLHTSYSETLQEKVKRDREYHRQLQTILKTTDIQTRTSLLKSLNEAHRISRETRWLSSDQEEAQLEDKKNEISHRRP